MKKTLLLTFVLVFALAASAMAAVNFGGSFTATLENDDFTFGEGDFTLTPSSTFNINAASSDDAWSFGAQLDRGFDLTNYNLTLNDDLFTITAWRAAAWNNPHAIGTKNVPVGLISAPGFGSDKVRLTAPVADFADVLVDLDPGNVVRSFVDFDVMDFPVGLAHQRNFGASDTVVGYGTFDVDFATIAASAGITLGEDIEGDNYAYGVDVTVPVTDEVTVTADYTARNTDFANGTGKDLNAGVTYTESQFRVNAGFGIDADEYAGEFGDATINAGVSYRFSETLAYGHLFHNAQWFNNDAPAVRLSGSTTADDWNVRLDAAAPVLPDVAAVRGFATYNQDEVYSLNADARVWATDKLTLLPRASFTNADNTLTVANTANYTIGSATLSFLASHTAKDAEVEAEDAEEGEEESTRSIDNLLRFTVSVNF